jgi:hypothetical protein
MMQATCRHLLRRSTPKMANSISARGLITSTSADSSPWLTYEMAPLDPIIGLNESFQKDESPNKVIVGVGAYRDEDGKPYVLPCVREAEKRIMAANLDMEYSGIVRIVTSFFHSLAMFSCAYSDTGTCFR